MQIKSRKKLFVYGGLILLLLLIVSAIEIVTYLQYERYKTEPVTVDSILRSVFWDAGEYRVSEVRDDESFQIGFRKEWIPADTEHPIEIGKPIKTVGDTTLLLDVAYRTQFPDGEEVTLMVQLENDTKKLRGQFLLDGYIGQTEVLQPQLELSFYHQNEPIEAASYGYGTGGNITVSLPLDMLEKYQYQIDVVVKGLVLYEYECE
ncbi:hypothetical protein [Fontibacillus sp. BL9]|uniref:hypothetical protein n=1 Tax=Fontibacillus sp. BL9 TaxID=3389971 RepID=UPI00397E01A0